MQLPVFNAISWSISTILTSCLKSTNNLLPNYPKLELFLFYSVENYEIQKAI